MTALVSYSTGTVSVAAGGTIVTGAGTIWSGTNARPGDVLQIGNFQSVISDVTDLTHLVVPPWGGGAQAGVAYKIWQVSPQRFAGSDSLATVNKLVAAFNTSGFFVFVDVALTAPDPSLGDDGQYAFQPTTGKTWAKVAGVWTFLGIYKAFQLKGAWSGATAYAAGDVVTLSGSSYVCVLDHTNHTPPNVTYWQLLASIGATGNTGPTGAGYGGTSTTSLAIGTGSKVFTTQAGLAYQNGARVRASSAANTTNWMEGLVTYSGTTLTMTSDKTNGSGTLADWNFNVVGQPGAGDLSSANNLSELAATRATAMANLGVPCAPGGRVTLTSGVPVLSGTTTGNGTIYYTPDKHAVCPIYDGTRFVPTPFAEVNQLVTDTTKSPAATVASKNYDLFAWVDSGTFRVTRGPAWPSDTSRGTGAGSSEVTRINGTLVNANAITNGPAAQRGTLVGTIRTRATDGLVDFHRGGGGAGGVAGSIGLSNVYNRRQVTALVSDTGTTWTYATAAWRAANNSSTIRVSWIDSVGEDNHEALYAGFALQSGAQNAMIGIGVDVTNTYSGTPAGILSNVTGSQSVNAEYRGNPGIGFHFASAIEYTTGATATYYGNAGAPTYLQTGLHVTVWF